MVYRTYVRKDKGGHIVEAVIAFRGTDGGWQDWNLANAFAVVACAGCIWSTHKNLKV